MANYNIATEPGSTGGSYNTLNMELEKMLKPIFSTIFHSLSFNPGPFADKIPVINALGQRYKATEMYQDTISGSVTASGPDYGSEGNSSNPNFYRGKTRPKHTRLYTGWTLQDELFYGNVSAYQGTVERKLEGLTNNFTRKAMLRAYANGDGRLGKVLDIVGRDPVDMLSKNIDLRQNTDTSEDTEADTVFEDLRGAYPSKFHRAIDVYVEGSMRTMRNEIIDIYMDFESDEKESMTFEDAFVASTQATPTKVVRGIVFQNSTVARAGNAKDALYLSDGKENYNARLTIIEVGGSNTIAAGTEYDFQTTAGRWVNTLSEVQEWITKTVDFDPASFTLDTTKENWYGVENGKGLSAPGLDGHINDNPDYVNKTGLPTHIDQWSKPVIVDGGGGGILEANLRTLTTTLKTRNMRNETSMMRGDTKNPLSNMELNIHPTQTASYESDVRTNDGTIRFGRMRVTDGLDIKGGRTEVVTFDGVGFEEDQYAHPDQLLAISKGSIKGLVFVPLQFDDREGSIFKAPRAKGAKLGYHVDAFESYNTECIQPGMNGIMPNLKAFYG